MRSLRGSYRGSNGFQCEFSDIDRRIGAPKRSDQLYLRREERAQQDGTLGQGLEENA
jgi:hypothetical protein